MISAIDIWISTELTMKYNRLVLCLTLQAYLVSIEILDPSQATIEKISNRQILHT